MIDRENLLGIANQLRRTAVYPDISANLSYPALGLSDEIAEFFQENRDKEEMAELGDVVWYLNQVAYELSTLYDLSYGWQFTLLDHDFSVFTTKEDLCLFLFSQAGKIAGIAKKIERDGIESAMVDSKMSIAMRAIQESFVAVANYVDYKSPRTALAVLMTRLLNKLVKRKARGLIHGDGSDR